MKGYQIPAELHKLKLHQKIRIALKIYGYLRKPTPYLIKIGLVHGLLSFCALPTLADMPEVTLVVITIFWTGALAASITINEVIRVITR